MQATVTPTVAAVAPGVTCVATDSSLAFSAAPADVHVTVLLKDVPLDSVPTRTVGHTEGEEAVADDPEYCYEEPAADDAVGEAAEGGVDGGDPAVALASLLQWKCGWVKPRCRVCEQSCACATRAGA